MLLRIQFLVTRAKNLPAADAATITTSHLQCGGCCDKPLKVCMRLYLYMYIFIYVLYITDAKSIDICHSVSRLQLSCQFNKNESQ